MHCHIVRFQNMIIYILLLVLGLVVYFKYIRKNPTEYEIISKYYGDNYWREGERVSDDTSIKPFKISIPDSDIEDLYRRINSTRYPPSSLENSKFHYGVNQKFMKEFVEYWRNSYSWREAEEEINKFDHFKTNIEGLDIHFVHVKPKNTSRNVKPKPLLLCHGWPGSFYEFKKIIPMLADPTSHGGSESDVFEIIAPSIPGYGFSQAPEVQGFSLMPCARIFNKLMQRLGHKTYYVQGGDWGTLICSSMAMMYPSYVKGIHVNMTPFLPSRMETIKMVVGSLVPSLFYNSQEANKFFPLRKVLGTLLAETGYMHIQATKPDTVGFGLSDSPVGLAAYIVEKFSTWTNLEGRDKEDGDLGKYWTKDELLTNIMIYWWSGNVTSMMRFYKEALITTLEIQNIKVRVPSGCAWFPHELFAVPQTALESKLICLKSFTYMKDGGHFAAFQVPNLLAADIRQFVRKVENVQPARQEEEQDFDSS